MDVVILTARSATQVEATVSCLAALCVGSWRGEEESRSLVYPVGEKQREGLVHSMGRLHRHQELRASERKTGGAGGRVTWLVSCCLREAAPGTGRAGHHGPDHNLP